MGVVLYHAVAAPSTLATGSYSQGGISMLRQRCLTSHMGQSRHFGSRPTTFALPLEADVVMAGRHVSKVPSRDMAQRTFALPLDNDGSPVRPPTQTSILLRCHTIGD